LRTAALVRGALALAVATALSTAPLGRDVAQATPGEPLPTGGTAAHGLDYLKSVFKPGEARNFDFTVDARARELKGVNSKVVDRIRFHGTYKSDRCPDAEGKSHANVVLAVEVIGFDGPLEDSQVELPIVIVVSDKATLESATFAEGARFFAAKQNRKGKREESRTRLDYGSGVGSAATIDNEGPYAKPALQKLADTVAESAGALADYIGQVLEKIWQDGHTCVSLEVAPSSKNVEPRQKLSINAAAKAKDGTEIARPISATFTSGGPVTPKASKKAPATFSYVSPAKEGTVATVTFEQRSNRGIGRADGTYTVCAKKRKSPSRRGGVGRVAPLVSSGVCKPALQTAAGNLDYHLDQTDATGSRVLDMTIHVTLNTQDGPFDEDGQWILLGPGSTYTLKYVETSDYGTCTAEGTGTIRVSETSVSIPKGAIGRALESPNDGPLIQVSFDEHFPDGPDEFPWQCSGDITKSGTYSVSEFPILDTCTGVSMMHADETPFGKVEESDARVVITYDCSLNDSSGETATFAGDLVGGDR
jgi:hypothetical protein